IEASPVFGHGWMNLYIHTKYISGESPLQNIREHQELSAVRDHATLLDLADAGGIPLAALFVAVVVVHLRSTKKYPSLHAGLWAVVVNQFFDTSVLWLVLYPHFWILLALVGSGKPGSSITLRPNYFRGIILFLFLFSGIFPLVEDFYLKRGS